MQAYENRFIREYQAGSAHRWVGCMAAVRVKERGDSVAVCRRLSLGHNVLTNMAQAGLAYRTLRHWAGKKKKVKRLHEIRQALTYSHFVMAGRYMFLREIPPKDLFDALSIAAEEGASTRELASYLVGEYGDPEENDAMWKPVMRRLLKEVDNALNNFATPFDVKMKLREIRDELRVYLGE